MIHKYIHINLNHNRNVDIALRIAWHSSLVTLTQLCN